MTSNPRFIRIVPQSLEPIGVYCGEEWKNSREWTWIGIWAVALAVGITCFMVGL